jgi:glycosyltransferase involved in cell wall biosynthesis
MLAGRAGAFDVFELPEFEGWLPLPLFNSSITVVVRLHQSAKALSQVTGVPKLKPVFICEYLTLLLNRNWIAVSNFILSHTQSIFGISPKNWAVVYNPVTVDAGLKSKIDQLPALPGPYFLFVGSLSVRKGVLTIAKAAKQILSNGISVRFVFVGPETMHDARPISATVFEIVGENNRQRIEFLGRLNHADSLYWMRHAVAVVLPSQIESFGLVPLEAMTLGTPAIFTSESAGREIINNGIDGFLVGPNDVELLGDRMLELLENSELRATMSMAAAESVKRFSAQKFVVDCENAYRQMGAS